MKKLLESTMAGGIDIPEMKRQCGEIKYGFRKKHRYLRRYFREHFDALMDHFDARVDLVMSELEKRSGAAGRP